MNNRSFVTDALVIKRKNFGESDRLLTLLSPEKGKFVTIAKGVRKMPSTKRAFLEPGNLIKSYVIITKSIPILSQVKIISDLSLVRQSLISIKELLQVLEIFDQIFVEEEIETSTFRHILEIMEQFQNPHISKTKIKFLLFELLKAQGFASDNESDQSITSLINEITNKKMKSFDYLTVKN